LGFVNSGIMFKGISCEDRVLLKFRMLNILLVEVMVGVDAAIIIRRSFFLYYDMG